MTARRSVAAAIGASAMLAGVPTAAHADKPSTSLNRAYETAYERAERAGHSPGRHIVDDGVRRRGRTRDATEREVRRSLGVLRRMIAYPAGTSVGTGTATAPATTTGSTASAGLQSIAACESGGDPSAVSPDGRYRGKYQFDQQTWQSVGGTGDPAAAPEAEQDARAQALMAQRGSSPWPVCGG